MQACSTEYKKQMRRSYRNNLSFMKVTVGVVNQEAQSNVKADTSCDYAYYSNLNKPFNNYEVSLPYATLEEGYTKVDDTMAFLPRLEDNEEYFNQGIVAMDMGESIRFVYNVYYDIKGLTIDFSHIYPVDFDIISDNITVQVRGNDKRRFVTDEVFSKALFIEIKPLKMLFSNNRLRIWSVTMGVGIYFDNRKILSSTKTEHISPIMEDLHNLDFSLNAENKDRAFDIENSRSAINFMEIGQQVEVQYGYQLDNGIIEWTKGCKLRLKSWKADDATVSLEATDVFDSLEDIYYKGVYSEEGTSLYELAEDVLDDAGIDKRDYRIDTWLKSVLVNNPMPAICHREALQLIANAGRCLLFQDRDGKICFKSDFKPQMSSSATHEAYYSKTANLLSEEAKEHYATLNRGYTAVSDNMYFLPRDSKEIKNTGYVSDVVSDENGLFTQNPKVIISLEADFMSFGITLNFSVFAPREVTFYSYNDSELVEEYKTYDLELNANIIHQFPLFDRLEIEFNRIEPHNRVVLDSVSFGDVTDYHFDYGIELKKYPVGSVLDKVKELNTVRTLYIESKDEAKELIKEVIMQEDSAVYEFKFSNASYNLDVRFDTGNKVNILYKSSYMIRVEVEGKASGELIITGCEYEKVLKTITKSLNPVGSVKKWENPLISSEQHANDVGEWVADYMVSDREYELTDRGEPRIDAGDLVFLENKYIDDMIVKISDYTLNFNGALSGSVKARRAMKYGVDRT